MLLETSERKSGYAYWSSSILSARSSTSLRWSSGMLATCARVFTQVFKNLGLVFISVTRSATVQAARPNAKACVVYSALRFGSSVCSPAVKAWFPACNHFAA